ncbi:hypothetical protein LSPCS325_41690 [Lysinibacillus sp. CTST325]
MSVISVMPQGRGVITDAGQLAVFAGCEGFRLTSFMHSFENP